MQALKDNNMQEAILNIIKYCMLNRYRRLAFETNALL
jgi:hypothetical protein